MAHILSVVFKAELVFLLSIVFLARSYVSFDGSYYKQNNYQSSLPNPIMGQRKGFWCNYMVKRNVSCTVSRLERRVEKYFYLCSSIYSKRRYCPGFRAKYVTLYAKEYRVQPVMIKDCCPGFEGVSCDKECFNCTSIRKLQETIEKIQNDQRFLAQIQLQARTSNADITEPGEPGPAGAPGPIGPQGTSGPQGPVGPSGPMGPRGPAGEAGLTGRKGESGEIGPEGRQGIGGESGQKGEAGRPGQPGRPGPPGIPLMMPINPTQKTAASHLAQQVRISAGDIIMGPKGAKGASGGDGEPGEMGEPGPPGKSIKGDQGDRGPVGPKGDKGEVGPSGISIPGAPGDDGVKGDKGDRGKRGRAGKKGDCEKVVGPSGMPGAPGMKGSIGDKGDKGNTGEAGASGERGPAGIPGLPASGIKEIRDELARLKARVQDLEINRCNCPDQRGLSHSGASLFDINKKK